MTAFILVVLGYVAAFIGGAVFWHLLATKVLGYAKQAVETVLSKL